LNPATPLSNLEYILDDIDMVTVMTVNPGFVGQKLIPAMLRKIKDVRALLDSTGHDQVEIQVDGNVSFEHIPAMVEAGATMLVGGTSSVFHKDYSIQEAVTAVREILEGLDKAQ
jgi:ribulose-phosphate 3-epimerase